MTAQSLFRDLALLTCAAAIGWWAHGPSSPVHAQHNSASHSDSDPALAFQYGGLGPDGQLTLYNPASRTLYIYPSIGRSSSDRINCLYSVQVDKAGAPLDRRNCAPGTFLSR